MNLILKYYSNMIKQALRKSNVNSKWRDDSLKKGFWANGSATNKWKGKARYC